MSNAFGLTPEQRDSFDQALVAAGFTQEDIFRIIRQPRLALRLYDVVRPRYQLLQPTWYVSPQQQIERAQELWPYVALPDLPKIYIPKKLTEVLLLHVPLPLPELWAQVDPPKGYGIGTIEELFTEVSNLRLVAGRQENTRAVWLRFDPARGRALPPKRFSRTSLAAASEVVSALIQFRDWPLSWLGRDASPILSGYEYEGGDGRMYAPRLELDQGATRSLRFQLVAIDSSDKNWACPSVAEC